MQKTLLYRMFGFGKVPSKFREQIDREGVELQDEGIPDSITFKKYRAPGRYHGWKRKWFSGSVVLTGQTFLALSFSHVIIGVPRDDPKLRDLRVSIEDENTLCVEFEAATFQGGTSGEVTVRLSTPLA
jgi:hypothetical protein